MVEDKLLLVKTHAFGDALMCTPAARETMVGAGRVWVLTGYSAAPVWERFPGVERVFVAPVPPAGFRGDLDLISWSLRNRRAFRQVSRCLVFQGSPMIRRWVRFLTKAPSRSCGGAPLGTWEEVFPLRPGQLAGMAYARTAGVEPDDWRPEFAVKPEEDRWAAGMGLPSPLFALAPGGGSNPRDDVFQKRWLPERFAVIAERLAASGFEIVLLGGPEDSGAAAGLGKVCGCRLLDLTGKTTWGQTAAVLDRCIGYLGPDTGTSHLAVARGVPSVVLFGPSSPGAIYPEGLITAVSGAVECSPCYSNSLFPGCGKDRAICMESIEAEEVWMAIRSTLEGRL
jgi:hypothetical protein